MKQEPDTAGSGADHEISEDLHRRLHQLGTKALLRLLERFDDELVVEGAHGVRYGYRSVAEYKRIKTTRPWHTPLDEWLKSFQPSDVFFDVGANIGGFALSAAKLHGDGIRVFAFEPAFDSFASLARNVLLNDLGHRVTPLQVALSDATAVQPFYYRRFGAGRALHALSEPLDGTRRRFKPAGVQPVMAWTLDDVVRRFDLPRPTKVKIDTDGCEARVVAGSLGTLGSGPCELWVELSEAHEGDPQPLVVARQLEGLGFECLRRVDHVWEKPFPHYVDAFFVRR